MKYISSNSNPTIKHLTLLQSKSRERKKQGLFVIEGNRELSRALEMGYTLKTVFYRENLNAQPINDPSIEFYELSEKLFDRISMRSGSEEVLAIARAKQHDLDRLFVNNQNMILVVEAPEKPGNIGALLRTSAAAGLDAVIIANPRTDLYHPQIIRNSLGGIFSLPIAMDTSENVISFLEKLNFNIVAAALSENARHYKRVQYKKPLALVFGTEDQGLSKLWIKKANQIVQIPVNFPIDSLNLSVSAGILIYHCLEH